MTIDDWKEELDRTDTYSYFRKKIEEVGCENFFDLYDYKELHNYFKKYKPYDEYKMFVCLCDEKFNEFVYSIKDKKDVLTYFLKNNSLYYSLFAYSNLESLKIFLKELKNNEKLESCNYDFVTVLPYDTVQEYIDFTDDIDEVALLVNYNHSIKKTFFLEDSRALSLINSGKISVWSIISNELKVSKDILNSNKFFDELKSQNIIDFRNNFDKVLNTNPSIVLEEKLNKYEDDLILNFDLVSGLLKPYEKLTEDEYFKLIREKKDKYLFANESLQNVSFDEYLKKLSKKKLFELIIDRLFKDNYYNVLINIQELFRYNNKVNLIEDEYLELYKKIIDFKSLSKKEQIEIFKKYKDSNLNTRFYEDLRKCKDHCYKKMLTDLYKPQKTNEMLSKKYGVDVYYLDGEDFSMIIRGLGNTYRQQFNLHRECFSLINQDNTSRVNSEFYYGYTNINHNNIIHVSENDSFSSNDINTTRKINRIMTSEEINSYRELSEIQIKTDNGTLRPDYIVVFDEITEDHIYDSKKLGIPIVLINEEKYNKKNLDKCNLFSDENNYIRSTFEEIEYIERHK